MEGDEMVAAVGMVAIVGGGSCLIVGSKSSRSLD
jgi:hypothetical protein